MDWLKDLTDHIVNATAARLSPKFDQTAGKVEAMGFKVEGLRLDVNRLSTKLDTLTQQIAVLRDKVDHLGGGGLTSAQLKTLTDLTAHLHVSAATLKAVVALNSPHT